MVSLPSAHGNVLVEETLDFAAQLVENMSALLLLYLSDLLSQSSVVSGYVVLVTNTAIYTLTRILIDISAFTLIYVLTRSSINMSARSSINMLTASTVYMPIFVLFCWSKVMSSVAIYVRCVLGV